MQVKKLECRKILLIVLESKIRIFVPRPGCIGINIPSLATLRIPKGYKDATITNTESNLSIFEGEESCPQDYPQNVRNCVYVHTKDVDK